MILTELGELQRALRRFGFKRLHRGRDRNNPDCQIYMKGDVNALAFELQLWGDGKHRVSNWSYGRMTHLPTDFRTVNQMEAAIEYQSWLWRIK